MSNGKKKEYAINIYIEAALLLPSLDWAENLEDAIKEIMENYRCKGYIEDEFTGNITHFGNK